MAGLSVLAVLFGSWAPACAGQGILEGLDVREGEEGAEIRVDFAVRVQYVTHAPAVRGHILVIDFRVVDPLGAESFDLESRDSLRPSRSAPGPLSEVAYEAGGAGGGRLTLWFTHEVAYQVRAGTDLQSFVVTVPSAAPAPLPAEPPAPEARTLEDVQARIEGAVETPAAEPPAEPAFEPPAEALAEAPAEPAAEPLAEGLYAVNLESALKPVDPASVAPLPGFEPYRLYTTEFEKDGKTWHRLRLGFFPSEDAARRALVSLQESYPRAWVVLVTARERELSAQTAIREGARAAAVPAVPAETEAEAGPGAEPAEEGEAGEWPALSPDRAAALAEEARTAMTAEDYRRAIQLYTKLLRHPGHPYRQEAQELLGLARERNGQLAHAKAEYEAYLELYPEGEGAERVRQRLAGLLSAAEAPKERLREAKRDEEEGAWQAEAFGSFSQFYNRDVTFSDRTGETVNLSDLSSDLDLTARARRDDLEVRTQFIGGNVQEFREESDNESRINTLFVEGRERRRDIALRLGRQSRSSGGVLGRFDGGLFSVGIVPEVTVNLVGGFPVASTTDLSVETDKYLYGLSLDLEALAEAWDLTVFAVNQEVDGLTDRRAVGGEVRYFSNGRSLFGLVDYDVFYNDLNIAQLVGNWVFPDRTTLNLTLDYRKSPILTTSNALQGQTVGSIDALSQTFSDSAIHDLAEDRTATSRSLTFGVSRPINTQFQASADVIWSHLSDTEASGGVPVTQGTGNEFFYTTQLIGTSLIKEGDIGILGLRYADASSADSVELSLNTRYPINRAWRVNPRFRVDYRWDQDDETRLRLRPSLRVDYRWRRHVLLELEAGGEWIDEDLGLENEETLGYFVLVGYRYDF